MVTHRHDQQYSDKPMELLDFLIFSCIGKACNGNANIYVTKKKNTDHVFAVRVCPLDRPHLKLHALEKEINILRQLKHANVLPCLESFIFKNNLCLITPLLDFGSVTDLIHTRFMFGLPEHAIVIILFEILKAIQYIHSKDFLHRGIRCSHILVSSDNRVCLTGFRQATNILSQGKRMKNLHDFSPDYKPNLLWLAPEVLQQNVAGYGTKSDIYSLGISACEMANGFPPFSDMAHMQMLYEKLRGTTPRLLDATTLPDRSSAEGHGIIVEQKERRFSSHFHSFTEFCLRINPADRPSATELIMHPFFKPAKKHKQHLRDVLYPVKPLTLPKGNPAESNSLKELFPPDAGVNASAAEVSELEWSFE